MALPAFALYGIERMRLMPRNKGMQLGLQLFFICLSLTFAVPMSMAAFPQIATIKVSDMEPEF